MVAPPRAELTIARSPTCLAFLHIPKAGGTSVTASLRDMFAQAVTVEGNLGESCFQGAAGRHDCVFYGHPLHGVASHVPRGIPLATMLRDPADHAVSNYLHLLRNPQLPLHDAAVSLGFAGLLRTHWQLIVFQAISLDVALSEQPIDGLERFLARVPYIRLFLDRIDIVGHLDDPDGFLSNIAWRTGHKPPLPAERLNTAAEHGTAPRDVRRLLDDYANLAADLTMSGLMRIERDLADIAKARARITRWVRVRRRLRR